MENQYKKTVFTRPKFPLGDILSWIAIIFLIYVGIVFFAFSRYFEAISVKGRSMIPTYNKNGGEDTVYVHKANYAYGDIVLIDTEDKTIIKRIIAMPGDKVELKLQDGEYTVFVNGEALTEPYINGPSGNRTTFQNLIHYKSMHPGEFDENSYVVGENMIFALGDNRAESKDSSYYGAFSLDKVKGKVFYSVDSHSNTTLSLFIQLFLPILCK